MPWPMVHFATASELLSDATPEFIVGSLAPDSIHVRTNERAEKAKTHLMPEAGQFATDEELRAFFNSNKERAHSDPKFMQYLCGYIAHVYTDRVWTFEIYPAYEVHPNGRSIYTQDVTKLEFMILRKGSEGHDLLNKLEAGKAFDLGGLLEQEVYQYRKEKVDFLNNLQNESLGDLNILSMELIEEFIHTTARRLRQLFTKWEVFKMEKWIILAPYHEKYDQDLANFSLSDEQVQFTAMPAQVIEEALQNSNKYPVVILNDETLVGFFILHKHSEYVEERDSSRKILVRALSITKEHQGNGYALAAMRALPELVKQLDPKINEIILAVNEGNIAAQKLYLKVGFLDMGERKMGIHGLQLILQYRMV